MAFLFDGRISQDHARGRDIDFEMTSPEYSVVSAHIAEINSRIPTADHDISSYANDLLKAGLIGSAGYDSAIGSARKLNPQYKIASLTSKAMDKIKTSPHLFSSLVTIVEKRDREFASILREEYASRQAGAIVSGSSSALGGVAGAAYTEVPRTAAPLHPSGAASSNSVLSSQQSADSQADVRPTWPRPTYDQLIKVDGSKLKVFQWITSLEQWQCSDFAHKLLKDDVLVSKYEKECKGKDEFVRKVLRDWLSRDDDDHNDSAIPRTWEALAQCVTDAGLPGKLAKAIRDTFPSGGQ